MGQIIGGAAKPKRCNLNKLSQFGTPAAGEHILVSSDNSMNAAGQGNFDCYVVGDGTKAATALELKSIASEELNVNDKNAINSMALYDSISTPISLSSFAKEKSFPANTGKWVVNYQSYKGIFIPITGGEIFEITPNSNACAVALLRNRDGSTTANSNVNYATGYDYQIVIDEKQILKSPSDATYLYISTYTTKDTTPSAVNKISYESKIDPIEDIKEDSDKAVESSAIFNELYEAEEADIDVSEYIAEHAYPAADGKWSVGYQKYYGVFIPCTGCYRIDIAANSNKNCIIAVLTTRAYTDRGDIAYAGEYISTIQLNAGENATIEIPSDATYIYVCTSYGNTLIDAKPQSLKFYIKHTWKEAVKSLGNEIDISEDISWNGGGTAIVSQKTNVDYGKLVTLSGTTWKGSNYYDCSGHSEIEITLATSKNQTTLGLCFYDDEKNVIGSYTPAAVPSFDVVAAITAKIAIPKNAKYFRTTYRTELNDFSATLYKLAEHSAIQNIIVAAHDAPTNEIVDADYYCTGVNDELVIQQAINTCFANGGGVIKLSSGTFVISSFPQETNDDASSMAAIIIPSASTNIIKIEGTSIPYGTSGGTAIVVSDTCYEALDSNTQYKIITCSYDSNGLVNRCRLDLSIENVGIRLPWNQKKIMCIDLLCCNRPYLSKITIYGYTSGYSGGWNVSITNPPAVAVEGCVGLRMTGGSNAGTICDYKNIIATGFYEGFKVGGEHVIASNLATIFCVYGYTFGNYPWKNGFNHPITMINCCDERGVNLPLFVSAGEGGYGATTSFQEVDMIGFNVERIAAYAPGQVLGTKMRDISNGRFRGRIDYTIQVSYSTGNSSTESLWESGDGYNFISHNVGHELKGTSSVRGSYSPDYMQQFFDTTLNKMLVCIDTATPTWVDMAGNAVD